MSDIVERLRSGLVGGIGMTQAADEIETLRARVAELEGALKGITELDTIDISYDPNVPRQLARAALGSKTGAGSE